MKMHPSTQRGIALLEALLAIIILAIGLLGTIGMQARAYAGLSEATMRAEATLAAESLLGVMSTDLANLDKYGYAHGATPGNEIKPWIDATNKAIPNATIDVTVTPTAGTTRSEVEISIAWTRKVGAKENKHVVTSYITP